MTPKAPKEKKSTVAIVWSPKEEKAEETEVKKTSALDPSKFVSRDVKKGPFVPRHIPSQSERIPPVKKEGGEINSVFTPRF